MKRILAAAALMALSAPAVAETMAMEKHLEAGFECANKQLARFEATSPSETAKALAEAAFDACSSYWEAAINAQIKGQFKILPEGMVHQMLMAGMKNKYIETFVPIVFARRAVALGK